MTTAALKAPPTLRDVWTNQSTICSVLATYPAKVRELASLGRIRTRRLTNGRPEYHLGDALLLAEAQPAPPAA